MKKREIVKKNIDFNDIINTGLSLKSYYYNIYYKDGGNSYPKFGLAVSKKCGNAVKRNKIKRQLRMIIDENKKLFKNSYNYIIMVKKSILDINYEKMKEELIKVIKKG